MEPAAQVAAMAQAARVRLMAPVGQRPKAPMECRRAVRVAIMRLWLLARTRRRRVQAPRPAVSPGADDMTDSSTAPGGALSAESAEAVDRQRQRRRRRSPCLRRCGRRQRWRIATHALHRSMSPAGTSRSTRTTGHRRWSDCCRWSSASTKRAGSISTSTRCVSGGQARAGRAGSRTEDGRIRPSRHRRRTPTASAPPDHNKRLSELRAWSVAQHLMAKGVPREQDSLRRAWREEPDHSARESALGLAREQLIVCLQKDRRVEIEASDTPEARDRAPVTGDRVTGSSVRSRSSADGPSAAIRAPVGDLKQGVTSPSVSSAAARRQIGLR